MKRFFALTIALTLLFGLVIPASAATSATKTYADIILAGGSQQGHFADVWDLEACDLNLSFTFDANGIKDTSGAHAWAQFGVHSKGYNDFNPTWNGEGAGVWLATDYDWTVGTFAPDPAGTPKQDMDEKLILQKAGGHGEGDYNLPSAPLAAGNNHRFWFDRDGVDQWQDDSPLAVNGGTYNTAGLYAIEMRLHATSVNSATAFMKVNGLDQGFETDGNWNTMELSPAGMTFTGDMANMQVFYGLYGYGATHTAAFKNIQVTGCRVIPVTVDIKPGVYPNSVNLDASGLLPVAILSSTDFDATQINPGSVTLAGAGVAVRGKDKFMAHFEDVNSDGRPDLLIQVNIEDIDPALFNGNYAMLLGMTFSGDRVEGKDLIRDVSTAPTITETACTTIQDGSLLTSDGQPILTGYDMWGYNYQARIFNGNYCDAYRNAPWCQAYAQDKLEMKWNDAWISNQDCDGDGLLDRHAGFSGYIGSGAWLTNHMSGEYAGTDGQSCNWDYFVKIIAAPADATLTGGVWYSADGIEMGPSIWGEFAIVQEVSNDLCAGVHGLQYLSPDHAGFGGW